MLNIKDVEKLQTYLDRLGDWAKKKMKWKLIGIKVKLHVSPAEGSAKLFPWERKDS